MKNLVIEAAIASTLKDTILMIPDNFRIHEITCIESVKDGIKYTYKLYPYFIKKNKK